MKLAIAYSTRDQVELTKQTFPGLYDAAEENGFHIYWGDGSKTEEGFKFFREYPLRTRLRETVRGGADAAIVWKLSTLLESKSNYTHIGLLENDVLLDSDWLEPTLSLFAQGK